MLTYTIQRAARGIAAALLGTLLVACGGGGDTAAPQGPPIIATFTATPAAQPFGGGQVVLSWNAPDASVLVIDNGVGHVSGLSNKAVNVTSGTTFMLTASNAAGATTATAAVTVAAQPAPTISSFTATPSALPAGGGSVTLSWANTDATSLSIDNGVGVVTGTSQVVNVAATTTFTLTATNPSGTVNKTSSVAVGTAVDRFVDVANGADANACTQAAPCKTIAKAMTGAPPAATVFLADGTYDTTTQGISVTIPDGVTLRASNPGGAILTTVALNATGSATVNGVVLAAPASLPVNGCASISASSSSGTPTLTLTGVLIKCVGNANLASEGTVIIGGSVKASMTPGALGGALYTTGLPDSSEAIVVLSGTAELLIQGGVIDGNNVGQFSLAGGLLIADGNSKLTLDGVTVRNHTGPALASRQGGAVVLRNGTLVDNVGTTDCRTGGALIMSGPTGSLTLDHATLSNVAGVGICVFDDVSNVTLQLIQSTITKAHLVAIQSDAGFGSGGSVTADGLSLIDNGWGIIWAGKAGTTFDLGDTTITGSTRLGSTGVTLTLPSGSFKLRGSSVSNNAGQGVILIGAMVADLGTAGDPGGNTFTGNGGAGVRSFVNAGQTVNAVGNAWIPNQQGADATGRYSVPPNFTPVPKQGPASGVNFKIDNASTLNL